MKNWIKIHEICQLYHIGPDSIRYYEKIGLIRPRRDENGYRLYGIQELYRLNVIRDLLSLGFSTIQIRNYLDERSIEKTLALLDEEEMVIEQHIMELKQKRTLVKKRRQAIHHACALPCGIILTEVFPSRSCVVLREKIERDEDIDTLLVRLSSSVEKDPSIIGNCDTGAMIELDEKGQPHYTSVFIVREEDPVDFTLPAGTYLTLSRRGKDGGAEALSQLMEAMQAKGLQADGPLMEFLMIDIHETRNPDEMITQLQVKLYVD